MLNYILGLNSIGFNTSASIFKNGKLIAAIEEERLTRKKRTRNFPVNAIKFCLETANISLENLDAIAISWNPLINLEKFENNISSNISYILLFFVYYKLYFKRLKKIIIKIILCKKYLFK